jgi:uncharacterized Zn finger protein
MDYYYFKPYVPVAVRRAQAAHEATKLLKKGQQMAPVAIDGRAIAKTFWGKAWCDNLERYSDYANRLPRGRTYVRNGSVLDLQVTPGVVRAMVAGSELYHIQVQVAAVPESRWTAVCADCAGAIDSVIELLQGRFSQSVMTRICHERTGLFPAPADIAFSCSCPDWASMCKHVAAVLYGIGARLDEKPELLFALRKVDQQDLIRRAGEGPTSTQKIPHAERILDEPDLSELFGIEIAEVARPRMATAAAKRARSVERVASAKPTTRTPARLAPTRPATSTAKRSVVSKRTKENSPARRMKR